MYIHVGIYLPLTLSPVYSRIFLASFPGYALSHSHTVSQAYFSLIPMLSSLIPILSPCLIPILSPSLIPTLSSFTLRRCLSLSPDDSTVSSLCVSGTGLLSRHGIPPLVGMARGMSAQVHVALPPSLPPSFPSLPPSHTHN